MISYKIALALFTFGVIIQAFTILSIFPMAHIPSPGLTITQSGVEDITAGVKATSISPFFFPFLLLQMIQVLFGAILMAVCFVPFLMSYGIPFEIAMIPQAPVWLAYTYDLFQIVTGHSGGLVD